MSNPCLYLSVSYLIITYIPDRMVLGVGPREILTHSQRVCR